ncbi:ornithine cyclodeaminase family protein [Paraburkholderia xenovorans]|uniref:ornithine cyclodeaminase family protein n=1 Tax=Paraburkholderia xenovorans TaxID=36873 RepID=UPI0038B95C5B
MFHITDELIDQCVTAEDAQTILLDAFQAFGRGDAAMQTRMRTAASGIKLSTLGAVIPTQDVAGAKVYTTVDGQFSFVIVLFSAADGRPLATLQAGAITRLRTAACSVLAAKRYASPRASALALFGAGTQGRQHAIQFCKAFPIKEILMHDPFASPESAQLLSKECGARVQVVPPQEAIEQADIVVTASRSPTPLFSGEWLRPKAFVAAIGSSLPDTRELDDIALLRAARVVVEWKPQSMIEAGDIVLASPEALPADKVIELSQALLTDTEGDRNDGIVIYKSVGVGLEDIALAGLAYRRIANDRARRQNS